MSKPRRGVVRDIELLVDEHFRDLDVKIKQVLYWLVEDQNIRSNVEKSVEYYIERYRDSLKLVIKMLLELYRAK